jgi:NADPH:quinone reductase-like Zn-dependent oxidoreductase
VYGEADGAFAEYVCAPDAMVADGGSLVGPMGLMLRGKALSPFVRQRLVPYVAEQSKDNLATLSELAESGKLAPVIERTYPLAEAPQAIRHRETEHARAKIVVTVA